MQSFSRCAFSLFSDHTVRFGADIYFSESHGALRCILTFSEFYGAVRSSFFYGAAQCDFHFSTSVTHSLISCFVQGFSRCAFFLFSDHTVRFGADIYFWESHGAVRCAAVRSHILRILRCGSVQFFHSTVRRSAIFIFQLSCVNI